jgi:hypothetical protein
MVQQLRSSSSISRPCSIGPQDWRVSRRESTRRPAPAGPPAARTGHHRLPSQQRLPRLGCVSQPIMIAAAAPLRGQPA